MTASVARRRAAHKTPDAPQVLLGVVVLCSQGWPASGRDEINSSYDVHQTYRSWSGEIAA